MDLKKVQHAIDAMLDTPQQSAPPPRQHHLSLEMQQHLTTEVQRAWHLLSREGHLPPCVWPLPIKEERPRLMMPHHQVRPFLLYLVDPPTTREVRHNPPLPGLLPHPMPRNPGSQTTFHLTPPISETMLPCFRLPTSMETTICLCTSGGIYSTCQRQICPRCTISINPTLPNPRIIWRLAHFHSLSVTGAVILQ